MHGGGPKVVAGTPLDVLYCEENIEFTEKGCSNLQQLIRNFKKFGVPVVVAINQFKTDTQNEIDVVKAKSIEAGAVDAILCTHWAHGGAGAKELAEAVVAACSKKAQSDFKFLLP